MGVKHVCDFPGCAEIALRKFYSVPPMYACIGHQDRVVDRYPPNAVIAVDCAPDGFDLDGVPNIHERDL